MNRSSCTRLFLTALIALACIDLKGQERTARLSSGSVAFGEISSADSIVNRGKFIDNSKEYQIKQEQGNFYLLSDGNLEGWVFKSSVIVSGDSSTKPGQSQTRLTPYDFSSKLKAIGLQQRPGRRSSPIGSEWNTTWEIFNFDTATKLSATDVLELTSEPVNEVNIQITGPTRREIKRVVFSAEIHRPQDKDVTIENAVECLKIAGAPATVVDSFSQGKAVSVNNWKVEISQYPNGRGYEIDCTLVQPVEPKRQDGDFGISDTTNRAKSPPKQDNTFNGGDFSYDQVTVVRGDFGFSEVIGELKNNSKNSYSVASFNLVLMDNQGKLISVESVTVTNFPRGATKAFSCPVVNLPQSATKFRFEFNSGF
jgi:hypothetical protein